MKLRFKTAIRYYTLTIQPDLLGEYDIICQWGGLYNHRRGCKIYHVCSETQIDSLLSKIKQRRKSHGYRQLV